MPGPVAAMPAPEPTNRPAPITPPMAIMDRWRFFSPAFSCWSGFPPDSAVAAERFGASVLMVTASPARRAFGHATAGNVTRKCHKQKASVSNPPVC